MRDYTFESGSSMSEGFVRQRRNLIIISVFVFFIHFTTIEIDNISIFGISFDVVTKSNDLLLGLYIVWAYFFMRYSQYFYQEGFKNFFYPIKDIIENRTQLNVFNYIKKNVHDFKFIELKDAYNKRFENNGVYYGETKTGTFKQYVPKRVYFNSYFLTILESIFLKSHFSDFMLPFLLSFFSFFYIIN